MKNTHTTLRELAHKYATILRKCAFLNAIILMSGIMGTPAMATYTGNAFFYTTPDDVVHELTPAEASALTPKPDTLQTSLNIIGSTFDLGAGGFQKVKDSQTEVETLTHSNISINRLKMENAGAGDNEPILKPILKYTYGPNNVYIDQAFLTGTVDFTAPVEDKNTSNSRRIHTVDTYLNDVDFTGYFNGKKVSHWDNYNGLNASTLTLSGSVTITDADISMSAESTEGSAAFALVGAGNHFDPMQKYIYQENVGDGEYNGTLVSYNGGIYETKADYADSSFMTQFYKNLEDATKGDDPILTKIPLSGAVPDYSKLMRIGQTYESGKYIEVSNTVENFKAAKLIDDEDTSYGKNSDFISLYYQVNDGKTYQSLAIEDTLNVIIAPPETSVKVEEDSTVRLFSSNLAGESYLDLDLRQQEFGRYKSLRQKVLDQLEASLDENAAAIKAEIEAIDKHYYTGFMDYLEEYVNDDDIKNKLNILTDAFAEGRSIDNYYSAFAMQTVNLDVSVGAGSTVEIGAKEHVIDEDEITHECETRWSGSRIGKESSGLVTIGSDPKPDNPIKWTYMDIWGNGGYDLNEYDLDGFSSIDHFGYNGSTLITNSVINLYPNSGILRSSAFDVTYGWLSAPEYVEAESTGQISMNHSIVNMYGSTGSVTFTVNEVERTVMAAPTVIFAETGRGNNDASSGSLDLTNGSELNVFGNDNRIYVQSSNTAVPEKLRDSLSVKESSVNIEPGAKLSVYHYDPMNGIAGTNDAIGGKISLDLNGIVNLKGTAEANIVSLTPTIDIETDKGNFNWEITDKYGTVNLYNGGFLNGIIDGPSVNVSLFDGQKNRRVKVGGEQFLKLQNTVLNLGTNILEAKELSVQNSIIETTINSRNEYGALDVDLLDFKKSIIRVDVNMPLAANESVTIQFMEGDKGKLKSEDFSYNIKYKFDYHNGKLTVTPTGASGFITLKDLNERMVASTWLSGGFTTGSPAMLIATRLMEWEKSEPQKFAKAIQQLKPKENVHGHQSASAVNQQIAHAVGGRLGGGRPSTGGHGPAGMRGRSGGDTFQNGSAWVQGLYNHAKLRGGNGYTGKTKGLAMGMDGMVNDHLKLGVAYAYSTSDIDADSSDTDVDTHTGVLYGEYTFGKAFVNALGTYGYSTYDLRKDTLVSSITSDYHMDALYGQVMGGYTFDYSQTTLIPEAGVRYLWTKAHHHEQTGVDQHIASNITDTLTGVLGGRLSFTVPAGTVNFTPEFKLAATYDLHQDKGSTAVRLANGSGYVVEGETLNRFGVETGAKIGMVIDQMEFSLDYEGKFKSHYQDHTGMINFKYNF